MVYLVFTVVSLIIYIKRRVVQIRIREDIEISGVHYNLDKMIQSWIHIGNLMLLEISCIKSIRCRIGTDMLIIPVIHLIHGSQAEPTLITRSQTEASVLIAGSQR